MIFFIDIPPETIVSHLSMKTKRHRLPLVPEGFFFAARARRRQRASAGSPPPRPHDTRCRRRDGLRPHFGKTSEGHRSGLDFRE
ncbi:hypothetical protein [Sinorhizobium sp. A49]|uniref:hypothetical protein n=1 Tax=Sinorhizobium sp. A49 TaxID=1945861 RepID=UPI00111554C1|nr:hypothetical protein [Sinorhizobium sp. A49]